MTADLAWLDQDHPHDEARSEAQVNAVLDRLGRADGTILDLGCGGGRLLIPLVKAGQRVIGVDRNEAALRRCRKRLGRGDAELLNGDFLDPDFRNEQLVPRGPYRAVLLLGNTFMTISDVHVAAELLGGIASLLERQGSFLIDDVPHDLWPLVTDGQWCTGIGSDPDPPFTPRQLIWAADDTVFTVRSGDQVDPGDWSIGPDEPRYRLWSMGTLELLARQAGLSAPEHDQDAGLLTMIRAVAE